MLALAMFSYAGFAALCLAMEKHHHDLLGRKSSPRQRLWLRVSGWALLLLALTIAVRDQGWAMGLVFFTAAIMASAVVLVFLMPYWPRLALGLAGLGSLLGPVSSLMRF
ncbi:DUF3325 domain-containing protein [Pseudomonas sp. R5(2019)]|uniref:DUF3325 domain-containing protein n=1 Tax=Pseudomonas sp. R5(2019) TaxID=2697566 RepID=UPI00141320C7|nr:DUF3325 domain-containing protein [Pseudomonas sp. R5(2019)]NBA95035.1 DUF3325 family protein [Pseudomonas sp. R5(2019)]